MFLSRQPGRLPVAWDTYQATVEDYQSQNIDHMSRLYTVEKSRLYIVERTASASQSRWSDYLRSGQPGNFKSDMAEYAQIYRSPPQKCSLEFEVALTEYQEPQPDSPAGARTSAGKDVE